jgi:hypothetical protein
VQPPRTHYARSGEVNIAYEVLGDGPIDLVHVPPFASNLRQIREATTLASSRPDLMADLAKRVCCLTRRCSGRGLDASGFPWRCVRAAEVGR